MLPGRAGAKGFVEEKAKGFVEEKASVPAKVKQKPLQMLVLGCSSGQQPL